MPRKSPSVVLVGRPNVGKSTLFNRMTGSRRAIVAPIAGTTRDALARPVTWRGATFEVFDTGGLYGASEDPLHDLVVEQGRRAMAGADLLVFVVDGREGLIPGDERIARELRETGRPVLLAVNKTDDKRSQKSVIDFYHLGLDPLFEISAEHGTGVAELLDAIVKGLGDIGTRGLRTSSTPPDSESPSPRSLSRLAAADEETRIAIVGRPNVGKSTLLNALIGEKISIVTDKPHTTRQRVLGVLNRGADQAVFIDTPGHARRTKRVLHRLMARQIHQALEDCDVALLVVDAKGLMSQDRVLIDMVKDRYDRTFLVVNKIDALASKIELLPTLDKLGSLPFAAMVPVSAKTGENLDTLVAQIFERLPHGPALFPQDMITDRDLSFRIAETIREKLMTLVHQEVPYGLTVEVEHLGHNEEGQRLVHALIWLERESQKKIVIGKGGSVLKQAGSEARRDLTELLGERVHLELWVKVREHWADSEHELQKLGFEV
jgi:GTPase